MTIRLRPIAEPELAAFAAIATDPVHAAAVRRYAQDLLARGAMRLDWCFLAERDGAPVGRIAFWALPGAASPSDIVLFDLPWSAPEAIGAAMLRQAADRARSLGAAALGHVLDTPLQAPQWQAEPERRRALLAANGFEIRRETVRFELDPATPVPPPVGGLAFRSMAEVGEAEFRAATERVTEGTLDRRIGDEDIFADAQGLQHEPGWWELAYGPDGALVGLVMPALAPSMATIGYVGVVPERRGRGHVHALLARGTATLARIGRWPVRADADTRNTPMADAFRRAGWREFAIRTEFERTLAG
ncbi:GNAT family N-acetyltransferase [Mycobacterium sp. KBS0706]|uniref:GNAT family N-acetyltransferase n=1 Tax=Mycobacterium sp. KBS0706 TaxID=2578109 RepID=UPI00110FB947|nr:GNAT family N-acetyltransferase [Mycobacterium sp. KBS0706]TSD89663.1 GNAT family N-acetyltransferase [Mycobacterium sp. KBS0706]